MCNFKEPVLLLVATRVTGQSDMIKSVLHFFLFDPVCAKKKSMLKQNDLCDVIKGREITEATV